MGMERNVRRCAAAAGWVVGGINGSEVQCPRSRRVPLRGRWQAAESSRLLGPVHRAETGRQIVDANSLDWGTSDELSPLETLMWRADAGRAVRSIMMAVKLLNTEPDWKRLVEAHEWASRMVPRLRDRVSEPFGFVGTPTWAR